MFAAPPKFEDVTPEEFLGKDPKGAEYWRAGNHVYKCFNGTARWFSTIDAFDLARQAYKIKVPA